MLELTKGVKAQNKTVSIINGYNNLGGSANGDNV